MKHHDPKFCPACNKRMDYTPADPVECGTPEFYACDNPKCPVEGVSYYPAREQWETAYGFTTSDEIEDEAKGVTQ